MWLKRIYYCMRYKRLQHTLNALPQHKPNRAVCEALIKELQSTFFRMYHPNQGIGTGVTPLFKTIDAYTQKLKELSRLIKDQKPIPPDWSEGTNASRITVDRFLTSADGYYLDVVKAVAEFQAASLNFCQLMEESDTATHGVYEHNLRILTKLFINLRFVTQQLIEVSLTNKDT